jgi:hypothetical protein
MRSCIQDVNRANVSLHEKIRYNEFINGATQKWMAQHRDLVRRFQNSLNNYNHTCSTRWNEVTHSLPWSVLVQNPSVCLLRDSADTHTPLTVATMVQQKHGHATLVSSHGEIKIQYKILKSVLK